MTLEKRTPFSPAGPMAATLPRSDRAPTVSPTPFDHSASAGSSSSPAEVTASTTGRGLFPSTRIARSPAARRRHANRPPAEQSYTVPVSGEREIDCEARGRRRRGPAQGADGEDDRHLRVERGKGVAPAEQAHAEAASPEVRPKELRGDLLPPHPPGGEVDDEHMFGEGHPPYCTAAVSGHLPRHRFSAGGLPARLKRTALSTGRIGAGRGGRGWRRGR